MSVILKVILWGSFLFLFAFNAFSQRRKSDCQDTLYVLTYKVKKYKRNGKFAKEKIVKIIVYADTNKKSCINKKISFREYQKYLGLQFYYRDSMGKYRERYLYYYNNGGRDSCLGFKDSTGAYLPFLLAGIPEISEGASYTNYLPCLICHPKTGTYKGWPTNIENEGVIRMAYNDGSFRFRFTFRQHVDMHGWQTTNLRSKWIVEFSYSPSMWIDRIEVEKHDKLIYEMFLIYKKVHGL